MASRSGRLDEGELGQMVKTVPIFTTDDGYVYLYAYQMDTSDSTYNPILQMSYLNEPRKVSEKS